MILCLNSPANIVPYFLVSVAEGRGLIFNEDNFSKGGTDYEVIRDRGRTYSNCYFLSDSKLLILFYNKVKVIVTPENNCFEGKPLAIIPFDSENSFGTAEYFQLLRTII